MKHEKGCDAGVLTTGVRAAGRTTGVRAAGRTTGVRAAGRTTPAETVPKIPGLDPSWPGALEIPTHRNNSLYFIVILDYIAQLAGQN